MKEVGARNKNAAFHLPIRHPAHNLNQSLCWIGASHQVINGGAAAAAAGEGTFITIVVGEAKTLMELANLTQMERRAEEGTETTQKCVEFVKNGEREREREDQGC